MRIEVRRKIGRAMIIVYQRLSGFMKWKYQNGYWTPLILKEKARELNFAEDFVWEIRMRDLPFLDQNGSFTFLRVVRKAAFWSEVPSKM